MCGACDVQLLPSSHCMYVVFLSTDAGSSVHDTKYDLQLPVRDNIVTY